MGIRNHLGGCLIAAATLIAASASSASTYTTTSPTGGTLPSGVTSVGGLVLDLTGINGARVVSEVAASSLYIGYSDSGSPASYQGNPLTIGQQSGFSSAVLSALGGGLSAASVRISLYDGDTGIGDGNLASGSGGNDFDAFSDTLALNGVPFGAAGGDFSSVVTQNTDGVGNVGGSGMGLGFRNDTLDTGFFVATAAQLAPLFSSLAGGTVNYTLTDTTPGDNYFDFTQGVDASLINVGSGPVVTPPSSPVSAAPEPGTWALLLLGVGAMGLVLRRRRSEAGVALAAA